MATTQGHLSQSQQDERLARAKAQAEKPKKGKFTGNLKTSPPTQPGDQKDVTPASQLKAPQAKAGDQKDVPEPKGEAKPKKAKKLSQTVIDWKKLDNFALEEKITIKVTGNPKRRDAMRRFALYKDGMTVGDYLKVAKDNAISNALAHADVRWDHAKGLISVTGARYKS